MLSGKTMQENIPRGLFETCGGLLFYQAGAARRGQFPIADPSEIPIYPTISV